ncbi:hypothetical protein MGI18_26780 [Bacillus sp. OVS6]|nr:hypothetical protein MGI18_26780 [Bacillus sp. OVS6]
MGGTFKRNHERTLIKIDIPESTGGLLKIITDQGDVFKSHKPAGTLSRTIEIPDSSLYVRAELWDAETGTPIVISNPIYFS